METNIPARPHRVELGEWRRRALYWVTECRKRDAEIARLRAVLKDVSDAALVGRGSMEYEQPPNWRLTSDDDSD